MTSKKIAVEIPVKGTPSLRVPGKNTRNLNDKPLFGWLLTSLSKIECNSKIDFFIDSESDYIHDYIELWATKNLPKLNLKHFKRPAVLAGDDANGNHLLMEFIKHNNDYDIYMQSHITCPFVKTETFERLISIIIKGESNSAYTAVDFIGWIRKNNLPINYDCHSPEGLKRSQDSKLIQETTSTYIFSKEFFNLNNTRTNETSTPVFCTELESLDIDTEFDFSLAEILSSTIN